jgi:hypothetical protein
MSQHSNHTDDEQENDPVWDLLKSDATAHPVIPSPWFAARTAALIHKQTPVFGFLRRWMIPIPFAALGLIILALHTATPISKGGYISSEEDFEQHMELLAFSE